MMVQALLFSQLPSHRSLSRLPTVYVSYPTFQQQHIQILRSIIKAHGLQRAVQARQHLSWRRVLRSSVRHSIWEANQCLVVSQRSTRWLTIPVTSSLTPMSSRALISSIPLHPTGTMLLVGVHQTSINFYNLG